MHDDIKVDVNSNPSHETLWAALAAAQAEFTPVELDKVNPHYKSRFASLAAVHRATRPALSAHGIAVSHTHAIYGDGYGVTTKLLFGPTGETLETIVPIMCGQNMQSYGSAATYAYRYGLCGLIAVVGEEDDDGNAAGDKPKQQDTVAPRVAATPFQSTRNAEFSTSGSPPAAVSPEEHAAQAERGAWAARVAKLSTPAELGEFLAKCLEFPKLTENAPMAQFVWDALADLIRERELTGQWFPAECELAKQALMAGVRQWDLVNQAKETFGDESY